MTAHLDEARWQALLAGRLPADERERLTRHLEEDCAACDDFLASRPGADALDGAVDDLLVGEAQQEGEDELAFERFYRDATKHGPGRRVHPSRRQTVVAALGALAATVAVLLAVPDPDPGYREKGVGPTAPDIRLEAFLTGGRAAAVPLGPDARVPVGSALALRVILTRPTCLHLWWSRPQVERLTETPVCLAAGAHVLARDGQALGLRVEEPGPMTVWAVPEDPETADAHARPPTAVDAPAGSGRLTLRIEPSRELP